MLLSQASEILQSKLIDIIIGFLALVVTLSGYIIWSHKEEKKYRKMREDKLIDLYDIRNKESKEQSNELVTVIVKTNKIMTEVANNIKQNTEITKKTAQIMETHDKFTLQIVKATRERDKKKDKAK